METKKSSAQHHLTGRRKRQLREMRAYLVEKRESLTPVSLAAVERTIAKLEGLV
jgi:hypothetical protein